MRKVIVHKDHEDASMAAAQLLLDRVAAHPAMEFHLGLSGGSTPRRLFELLAGEPFRSQMPWGDLRFWFADERAAPPDSPLSNFRQAEELLFAPLEIPRRHVLRIPAQRGAAQAAAIYDELMTERFGALPDAEGLDMVLLGMGADGHTASLFPGHVALERPDPPDAWAVAVEDLPTLPDPGAPYQQGAAEGLDRVSLSLAALNASACAVLLVTGAAKSEALAEALRTAGASSPLPAGRVAARETIWIVDQEAQGR